MKKWNIQNHTFINDLPAQIVYLRLFVKKKALTRPVIFLLNENHFYLHKSRFGTLSPSHLPTKTDAIAASVTRSRAFHMRSCANQKSSETA
ncbi:hypothetical protein [Pseudomonas sp. MS19]|uniref:hypothetical protein n=1 Tax=Pseudomonas sp. MS19 TaxID=2579939 RepID=UPI001561ED77|nr:hypothetical protein [Pseudomonas sp. MS19]NRH26088.1 hypothetical protein [Pseudomonas sp. MS19]